MGTIKVNVEKVFNFLSRREIYRYQDDVAEIHLDILNKRGKGSDFLGWVNLPSNTSLELLQQIKEDAKTIKKNSDVYVVIGIGGSYLGARAVIEALNHNFYSVLPKKKRNYPVVIYAGQNLSEDYMADLLELLDLRDYSVAVISKSGTTTEPAIAFRIIKKHIEKKYGKEEAVSRIIAITDKEKGILKKLATEEGYKTYVIPDDVGGRYSVLTPVGLLPIAVAGFDIEELIKGALDMQEMLASTASLNENPAALYATTRFALYKLGKDIEILACYEPQMQYFIEWFKQLFGESEGKENKGLFPAGTIFTTDLHSLGQYIQEGLRNLFETVLSFEKPKYKTLIPNDPSDADGLNFLSGKRLNEVNRIAEIATIFAHVDGKVPNIHISVPEKNEYYLGQLIYFFEFACAISGYLLRVNPFDQPGVEAYKKNMFALLGKPGYEELKEVLMKRMMKE